MNDEKQFSKFPELETNRLKLRKITVLDAQDIFEYASDPSVAEFLIWEPHQSINDSLCFINFAEKQFLEGNSVIWGIELKEENKLIGTIDLRGLNSSNRCGDSGYVISKKYWGKGIVSEAFKRIIMFGFVELDLNRIEAYCEHVNIGSWKVLEKSGLIYEGTLREKVFIKNKFRTMKMYSILKSDWHKNDQN